LFLEAVVYSGALAGFGFVVMGAALMRHEMLLLACVPAVFVALVTGFVQALYVEDVFGGALAVGALAGGVVPGWLVGRRLGSRDLLLVIYLVWAVALVLSGIGFGFPDRG
jgi:hypothetical protein